MLSVYKYPLLVEDLAEVELPQGARILRVDVQVPSDVHPTIWALVDPAAPVERRRFRIAGTGHAIDEAEASYFVATVLAAFGSLVWHVFEIDPPYAKANRSLYSELAVPIEPIPA